MEAVVFSVPLPDGQVYQTPDHGLADFISAATSTSEIKKGQKGADTEALIEATRNQLSQLRWAIINGYPNPTYFLQPDSQESGLPKFINFIQADSILDIPGNRPMKAISISTNHPNVISLRKALKPAIVSPKTTDRILRVLSAYDQLTAPSDRIGVMIIQGNSRRVLLVRRDRAVLARDVVMEHLYSSDAVARQPESETKEASRKLTSEEEALLAELYEEYHKRILRKVYYKTGNIHIAEDITEMVFQRAAKAIIEGRYREEGKGSGWLGTIAERLIIDHYREDKKDVSLDADPTYGNLADEGLDDFELRDSLREILLELRENYRKVIILRFIEGLDFDQIALTLGIKEATARLHMHRGLKEFRAKMQQ